MKKFLSLLLSIGLVIGMVPMNVMAQNGPCQDEYPPAYIEFFDGENGTLVMPYMYYEYKLSKGKIKLVNEFEKREITDRKNRKTNKITKNGKKCSEREFNNVQNSLENEIVFVANTKSNRQMKGVNTVIKKKKSTTKVPAKTLKEISR